MRIKTDYLPRVAAVIAAGLVIGCGQSEPRRTVAPASAHSRAASGVGPIAIRTTDGAMELGLVRDTVYMGLSDSVVAKARSEMARDTSDDKGFGGPLSRFVKKTVGSALMTQITYPLEDIQGVRYEDGMIKFTYGQKRTMSFEQVTEGKQKALASFSPEDAQRFVATVNAALIKQRGAAR